MLTRSPFVSPAILLLAICSQVLALPGDRWVDLPPLPRERQEVAVAALDGKVYVIGGILPSGQSTAIVERFDTAANRWETVAPLPENSRLDHVGAAAAAGKIYSIGGIERQPGRPSRTVRSVFAFAPGTGIWARVASLPRARGAMGVAELDGRIYAAGGQGGTQSGRNFAVYFPEEDRWQRLADMPTGRNHLAAAAVDGVFYAISGRQSGLRRAVEAYDPTSNSWSRRAPIPTARGGIAAAALGGVIFVFGGEGNPADARGIFQQTEAYHPGENRWEPRLDMAHPRHGIGAAAVADRIYIPGGSDVQGFGTVNVHDAFLPALPPEVPRFLRGDANRDDVVDISDAVFTLLSLFAGGGDLPCPDAADANDDGSVDLSDAVYTLEYLFRRGTAPPAPGPGPGPPGPDSTEDALGC